MVKPMRLPPLERLRVRNPNKIEPNPCMLIMSQVLSCWASGGLATSGCANVEQTLRACMDKPPAPARKASTINFHLERFSKQLTQKAGMKK
ncbi:hypothetical protein B0T18DRAFT_334067 [Schizothecium vesticola]|uniref:Small ribosomal subunit protein mS37 n=1 Tax=Schizothecium vesticola TaxID=314040 RepID=A0AA40BPJ2_9PEZI|nr:hypothetical protein B0T18DRAFT_334067 [Schizothecium vesticola]